MSPRSKTSTSIRTVVLISASLLVLPVAGCSMVGDVVNSVSGGTIDAGGDTVPDDFPAVIPIVDGTVVYGGRVGTGTGKVWNLTITSSDEDPMASIVAAFGDAGFDATTDVVDTGGSAGFANGDYAVAVVVTTNADTTSTVNYTVTAVPQ
jgi:hypothetical protein